MARRMSTHRNSRLMTSAVAGISSDRKRSRRFSNAWVKRTRFVSPNEPAPPLMECAERKMAFKVSTSSGAERRASRSVSMDSTCSALSCTKVWRNWLRSIFMGYGVFTNVLFLR